MAIVGYIALALVVLAILIVLLFAVRSTPDIRRYLRMRKM